MSRKRREKKEKQKELAKQLGVSKREAEDFHHLRETPRVTRPEITLKDFQQSRKLLKKSPAQIALALYLVEDAKGGAISRVAVVEVDAHFKRTQLDKLSYTRPARFVFAAAADVSPFADDALPALELYELPAVDRTQRTHTFVVEGTCVELELNL